MLLYAKCELLSISSWKDFLDTLMVISGSYGLVLANGRWVELKCVTSSTESKTVFFFFSPSVGT